MWCLRTSADGAQRGEQLAVVDRELTVAVTAHCAAGHVGRCQVTAPPPSAADTLCPSAGFHAVLISTSRVERLLSEKGGVMSGWVFLAWLGVAAITILRIALVVGLVAVIVLVARGVWRYHAAQPMS